MRLHAHVLSFLSISIVLVCGHTSRSFQQSNQPRLPTRASGSGDVIRGVNLGGWLLTEEWITPSLFTGTNENDEWGLCSQLGKKSCQNLLEDHWSTFFTRDDFVDIKAAGLNSLRIPLGYWAVDLLDYEPYVSGQYPYLIRAITWASQLGLTVIIDLHGAPGSQNGQDNSGLIGPVEFQANSTNSDRSLNVLRNLTDEFGREDYGGVVVGVELLNEPRLSDAGLTMTELKQFYAVGTSLVRTENPQNSINVTIHDAFYGPTYWANYIPSSTSSANYLTLDTHQYYAFSPLNNLPHEQILDSICNISQILKRQNGGVLPVVVGEWSLETGTAPNASSSAQNKMDNQDKRTRFRLLFEAQLAAYSPNGPGQPSLGWYYWTWKTEYDIDTWSYRRGISQGYIPSDVSNASTLAFPILENGCVDAGFNYTAPAKPGSGTGRLRFIMGWELLVLVVLGLLVVLL